MQRKKIVTERFNLGKILLVTHEENFGTTLQFAAFSGGELIVKRLLKANADVNLRCKGSFDDVRPLEMNSVLTIGCLIIL